MRDLRADNKKKKQLTARYLFIWFLLITRLLLRQRTSYYIPYFKVYLITLYFSLVHIWYISAIWVKLIEASLDMSVSYLLYSVVECDNVHLLTALQVDGSLPELFHRMHSYNSTKLHLRRILEFFAPLYISLESFSHQLHFIITFLYHWFPLKCMYVQIGWMWIFQINWGICLIYANVYMYWCLNDWYFTKSKRGTVSLLQ